MNDPAFLGLTIVLFSIALFLLSPRRFRHWSVLAFVILSFLVALIGLPAKFIVIIIVAVLLWVAGQAIDRWE